ncbi:MAG: hypothetical protein QGI83_04280 [Candidatus Latescibacteria bacterium]|jgi:hypothetical protein|nr:hypothetical protein [Candidatus Latescibacterota bacterium]
MDHQRGTPIAEAAPIVSAVPCSGGSDAKALLMESLALARQIRDSQGYGSWDKTLVFLRTAAALRLHGFRAEALEPGRCMRKELTVA